ncbi:MAG: DUF5348 domain-containing protein [Ruminococcus flavefaciens]|nr:DUF5348 domain-containing protein [Ruminococcus flavefaciens]MCM1059302.1 DUF5348 domain-containing protein [Eubacterium sp.]
MNINELMKSLSELNSEFTRIIKKTEIEKYDDLSEIEADSNSPEQLLLVEELRKVMLNISEASGTISYLQKPIRGEYVLHKNSNGRYECSAHEYTCGNCIEYYAYDDWNGYYRWVVSSVEHNGDDYYIVGSKSISSDGNGIPLEGLRVRIR